DAGGICQIGFWIQLEADNQSGWIAAASNEGVFHVGESILIGQRKEALRFVVTIFPFLQRRGVCGITAAVWLMFCAVAFAEVIDRIVAVADGQIITLSDLRQEREIRALLAETRIDDDNILAKQLVDSQIIQRQIADYPSIEVTEEDINAEVKKLNLH